MVKNDIKVFTIDSYATDVIWTDTKISDDLFCRTLGKNTIYIQSGKIIVREKQLNAKQLDSKLTPNTDIETGK